MGLLDSLGDLVKQAASGNMPAADVHSTFDKVSQAVPQGTLADGISHVFNSDQTPPVPRSALPALQPIEPGAEGGAAQPAHLRARARRPLFGAGGGGRPRRSAECCRAET